MHRGSQNESKIKGATPVAVLSDLSTEEHLAVYYFRVTFEDLIGFLDFSQSVN